MATKARTTKSNGTQAEAITAGTGFVKDNVEKAVKGYDTVTTYSKATMEACMQSAQAASRGLEAINTEALAFSKQHIEDAVSVTKAAMSAKSIEEVYSLQNDFAKTAMDAYWGQMTKLGEMMTETVRESWEPLTGNYQDFVKTMQAGRQG